MTYTQLAVLGVLLVVVWDLWIVRTRLLTRRVFWMAYPIIVFFQLLTNGVLTGFRIVRYSGEAIIGSSTPESSAPPALGDGRILFAPVEDLMFGFALVMLTLTLWVLWGGVASSGSRCPARPCPPWCRCWPGWGVASPLRAIRNRDALKMRGARAVPRVGGARCGRVRGSGWPWERHS